MWVAQGVIEYLVKEMIWKLLSVCELLYFPDHSDVDRGRIGLCKSDQHIIVQL